MDLNARFNQRIIEDIEGPLLNIDRELKALSPAAQKKLIKEERDRLMALARNVLANRDKIDDHDQIDGQNDNPPGVIDRGIAALRDMFDWVASKLVEFLGYDPFKWCYFQEYDHNPGFANRAFSNPSLIDAMAHAGQILEEKQSPHLKHFSRHFNEKVDSVADVEKVAKTIIAFCGCLPSARNGDGLDINVNDVKLVLMNIIKLLLEKKVSEERFEELHSNPLVLDSGEVCWVKHKFVSNTYIQVKDCNCKEKRVDLDVTIWYYWFPTESDFRQALRRIE